MSTSIIQRAWLPATVALVAAVGGYKFLNTGVKTSLNPEEFLKFKCSGITRVNHNTNIFRFDLPSASHVMGMKTGQCLSVRANVNGKEQMRSYTPITDDTTKGHFELLIKSYEQGNVSKYFGGLKVGDEVEMRGPKGQILYQPNTASHITMIAGGSGITPMLQIMQAINRNKQDKTKVTLIFGNQTENDIILRDELDQLAKASENITVHYALDRAPENWVGIKGYVTQDILKDHIEKHKSDSDRVVICGPPPMVKSMLSSLEGLGYKKRESGRSTWDDKVIVF